MHAAAMFNSACVFRDRNRLAEARAKQVPAPDALPTIHLAEIAGHYAPIAVLDNVEGAVSIYGFQLGRGAKPLVAVGNERGGLARDFLSIADRAVQIPMVSRKLNCLNVADAAGVALYYMTRGGGGKLVVRGHPDGRRPELMLMGVADHVELGSSIRSAGTFGWSRLMIDDRRRVWFGRDRISTTESRAAARRARNPIRIVPTTAGHRFAFSEVSVVTLQRE